MARDCYVIADYDSAEILRAAQTPGTDHSSMMAEAKVAAICAFSWIQNGWNPKFIRNYDEIPWRGNPELVLHADLFNNGFSAEIELPCPCSLKESLSAAALFVRKSDLDQYRTALATDWALKQGESEPSACLKIPGMVGLDYMSLVFTGRGWENYPLIHFTRWGMQAFPQDVDFLKKYY